MPKRELEFDEVRHKLAQNLDTRFFYPTDRRSLLLVSLLAIPLALGFAYFASRYRNASPWPFTVMIGLYLLWILFIRFGYQPIQPSIYENLSAHEKEKRTFYNSMWLRLLQSGIGFYLVTGLLWGVLEASLYWDSTWLPFFIMTLFLILVLGIILARKRILALYVEGFHTHKQVKLIVGIIFAVIGSTQILIGVSQMMRVQIGQENTVQLLLPLVMMVMMLFIVTISIMTFIASAMFYEQYKVWKYFDLP